MEDTTGGGVGGAGAGRRDGGRGEGRNSEQSDSQESNGIMAISGMFCAVLTLTQGKELSVCRWKQRHREGISV